MSTDYYLCCFDCKKKMRSSIASGSISYGYKVWGTEEMKKFLGHNKACGDHEGHDLRIVSEHYELPWEDLSEKSKNKSYNVNLNSEDVLQKGTIIRFEE